MWCVYVENQGITMMNQWLDIAKLNQSRSRKTSSHHHTPHRAPQCPGCRASRSQIYIHIYIYGIKYIQQCQRGIHLSYTHNSRQAWLQVCSHVIPAHAHFCRHLSHLCPSVSWSVLYKIKKTGHHLESRDRIRVGTPLILVILFKSIDVNQQLIEISII